MKKKILSLFIVATMVASVFTGCASDTSGNSKNSETSENSASNTEADKNKPNKVKEEYSLSEYLSLGESIWYLTNDTGKDAEIRTIYVMEADGTMYYTEEKSGLTLGEVEQKEDAEIAKEVKAKYAEDMKEKISEVINDKITYSHIWGAIRGTSDVEIHPEEGRECYLADINEEYIQEIQNTSADSDIGEVATKYAQKYWDWRVDYLTSKYETYLKNIPTSSYKLSIVTDSTGNRTQTETLFYQEAVPMESDREGFYCDVKSMELEYIYPYESNQGATNCFNIYDSWYGGYGVDGKYFVTRLSTNIIFKLDDVGTKDISIDVKDEYSLFNKDIIIELYEPLVD